MRLFLPLVWAAILAACAPSQAVDPGRLTDIATAAPPSATLSISTIEPTATLTPVSPTESVTDTPQPLPTAGPPPGRVDPSPVPQTGEAQDEIVKAAVRAALEAAGLPDGTAVSVVRAEAMLWPDGSLGCPKIGVMYTQGEVPGYWIELEVADQHFDYRFGTLDIPILCAR